MKAAFQQPKFLLIRRDNIGDLVCTTPTIAALRQAFPDAYIAALVTSYNVAVLDRNPYLDAVFAYTKLKHRPAGQSRLQALVGRVGLLLLLRKQKFDYVLLASPHYQPRLIRLGRWLSRKGLAGFVDISHANDARFVHRVIESEHPLHEVVDTFRLLTCFGIQASPPACRITPDDAEVARFANTLSVQHWHATGPLIGLHISARKESQRWPARAFADLVQRLHQDHGAKFLLFWSPGKPDHPLHPGDDDKATEILNMVIGHPVLACPTQHLDELIAGLSLCNAVICSDGGAMHLAAALGKPIVCFFGRSDAARWYPWGVPYMLLQKESREVSDISVEEAAAAFAQLAPIQR